MLTWPPPSTPFYPGAEPARGGDLGSVRRNLRRHCSTRAAMRGVRGLVLLNPWLRTEAGAARAYLRHYYLARLFNPELWRKIRRGEFAFGAALHGLLDLIMRARTRGP